MSSTEAPDPGQMVGRKVVSPNGTEGVVISAHLAPISGWFDEKPPPKFVTDAIAAASAAAGGPGASAAAEAAYQACMSQDFEFVKRVIVNVWFQVRDRSWNCSYIISNGTHSKEQGVPKGNLISWAQASKDLEVFALY